MVALEGRFTRVFVRLVNRPGLLPTMDGAFSSRDKNQEQALVEKKADLEGTQKELDAALAYFKRWRGATIRAAFR